MPMPIYLNCVDFSWYSFVIFFKISNCPKVVNVFAFSRLEITKCCEKNVWTSLNVVNGCFRYVFHVLPPL